jgi:hypothetical protein
VSDPSSAGVDCFIHDRNNRCQWVTAAAAAGKQESGQVLVQLASKLDGVFGVVPSSPLNSTVAITGWSSKAIDYAFSPPPAPSCKLFFHLPSLQTRQSSSQPTSHLLSKSIFHPYRQNGQSR